MVSWLFSFALLSAVIAVRLRRDINYNYNEEEAKLFLNLSAAAYATSPQDCVQKVFDPSRQYQLMQNLATRCDRVSSLCSGYILRSDLNREIVIVFRGTKTQQQLLLEGWASLKPGQDFFGFGNVNSYFYNAHNLLWDNVELVLKDTSYQNYRVAFTGHSLGAALAALAAARTVVENLRPNNQIRIITFGEPRVGNIVFAKNFDQAIPNSFRVVYRQDIVPHLPGCLKDSSNSTETRASQPCDPNNLVRAYHHSTEVWYPDCMDPGCPYKICTGEPTGEDFSCSDQYKFNAKESSTYIWDHRHYFGVKVTEYGKQGCDNSFAANITDIPSVNTKLDKVLGGVQWAAGKLGIGL